jgi:hypothetical protein
MSNNKLVMGSYKAFNFDTNYTILTEYRHIDTMSIIDRNPMYTKDQPGLGGLGSRNETVYNLLVN